MLPALTRDHEKELRSEIRQRIRAEASGELVRPPKTLIEQEIEEQINSAEIDRLEERRTRLWSALAKPEVSDGDRESMRYSVSQASESLRLAFAVRRRLAVARSLLMAKSVIR